MTFHISLPSSLLLLVFPMLVYPPLHLQHYFALSSFYFHHTSCYSLIPSLFVFFLLFSIFISSSLESSLPHLSLGLFFFFFMISPFHINLSIHMSFFFSEANKEFFMFLLVSPSARKGQQQVQPVSQARKAAGGILLPEAQGCIFFFYSPQ